MFYLRGRRLGLLQHDVTKISPTVDVPAMIQKSLKHCNSIIGISERQHHDVSGDYCSLFQQICHYAKVFGAYCGSESWADMLGRDR